MDTVKGNDYTSFCKKSFNYKNFSIIHINLDKSEPTSHCRYNSSRKSLQFACIIDPPPYVAHIKYYHK